VLASGAACCKLQARKLRKQIDAARGTWHVARWHYFAVPWALRPVRRFAPFGARFSP
jgi:hypothetical protein